MSPRVLAFSSFLSSCFVAVFALSPSPDPLAFLRHNWYCRSSSESLGVGSLGHSASTVYLLHTGRPDDFCLQQTHRLPKNSDYIEVGGCSLDTADGTAFATFCVYMDSQLAIGDSLRRGRKGAAEAKSCRCNTRGTPFFFFSFSRKCSKNCKLKLM